MIIFCGLLINLGLVCLVLLTCKSTRYYVFFHKDYKLWKQFLKQSDIFEFDYVYNNDYVFCDKDHKYVAMIWNGKECSIHNRSNYKCICCTFFEESSEEMARILMSKIKK